MRLTFKTIIGGALMVLFTMVSCDNKEETDTNSTGEHDDSYYAAQAVVSSSDANYTADGNDGTVQFKAAGGQVVVNVNCGCDWIVDNNAEDLFTTSITNTTLTITAAQNTVASDLTGMIRIQTASWRITFSTITVNQSAYGAPEITVETSEWHAPAVGALTAEIAVDASADWTAESADSWLTVSKTENGINLTAAENEETSERSTKVTLTCADGIKTAYEYVTVTQDGSAYVELSSDAVTISSEGGSASITVESNFDWDFSYDTSNGWLTVSRSGNTLTATAKTSDGIDSREGTVTVSAGDGAENVAEAQLTVIQARIDESALVLTYTVSSSNRAITLPLSGTVNCVVNWGDGSSQTVTSSLPSHTYSNSGVYSVSVSGTVTALSSSSISSENSPNTTLTAVQQWGSTGLTSMNKAFDYYTKLASLPESTGGAFADVTNFAYVFEGCSSLTTVCDGLFKDCSKSTTFAHAFSECTSLTTIPADLFQNCSGATTFLCCFYNCTSLKSIPAGLFDTCTNVTSFDSTFQRCSSITEIPTGLFDKCPVVNRFYQVFTNCTSLKSIPDGLFDNCPVVTTFFSVFYGCAALTTIPAGLFDKCTEVTTFGQAFIYCSGLKSIPTGLFDKCTKVTSFQSTFYECSSLTDIPKGLFDKCTEATSFSQTFIRCLSLAAIPEGLFDNCTKVTTFNACFQGCSAITEIPKGLFDNCPAVTSFNQTFYNCESIKEIPEGLFDNCPEVTAFGHVFRNCTSLVSIPNEIFSKNVKATGFSYSFSQCTSLTGESPYDIIDGVHVHLYERSDYPGSYATLTTYGDCFAGCTGLSDYNDIPAIWGGGGN